MTKHDFEKKAIKALTDGQHVEQRKNGTRRVFTVNKTPSKTDQSFREEVNVNSIMLKYHKTGNIKHLAKVQGRYADNTDIPDLKGALEQVKEADELFMGLPSKIRSKFNHSATNMLDFLRDPANDEEAQKLGLRETPKIIPPPPKVDPPVIDPPTKKETPTPKA